MKTFKILGIFFLMVFCFFAITYGEDVIYLESGGKITGKIQEITDTKVIIKTSYGMNQVVFRDNIQKIVRGFNAKKEYEKRFKKLEVDFANSESYYLLGLFCEKYKSIHDFAKKNYKKAIQLNPDHYGARSKLGYERYRGKWMIKKKQKIQKIKKKKPLKITKKKSYKKGNFPKIKKRFYGSGALKERYTVNQKNEKHGKFIGYYKNKKIRSKGNYKHGKLDGKYFEYNKNGKLKFRMTFKKGHLEGKWIAFDKRGKISLQYYFKGNQLYLFSDLKSNKIEPAYPKSKKRILKMIKKLRPTKNSMFKKFEERPRRSAPFKAGKLFKSYRLEGLRQVAVYRFLCDIPYDLQLHDQYHYWSQHGAVLVNALGHLDHTPKIKPDGMSDEFFKIGYKGTSMSNLHQGQGNIIRAVDGFMDDSDKSNIDVLGHRRWLLNPRLKKLDFGESNEFVALFAMDQSRLLKKNIDKVFYPSRGFFPLKYFPSHYAWSVMLNKNKYFSLERVDVQVWLLDQKYRKKEKLTLDHLNFSKEEYGIGYCIGFRPKYPSSLRLKGAKFLIHIEDPGKNSKINFMYIVEFF